MSLLKEKIAYDRLSRLKQRIRSSRPPQEDLFRIFGGFAIISMGIATAAQFWNWPIEVSAAAVFARAEFSVFALGAYFQLQGKATGPFIGAFLVVLIGCILTYRGLDGMAKTVDGYLKEALEVGSSLVELGFVPALFLGAANVYSNSKKQGN
jgi:hypothetical protein